MKRRHERKWAGAVGPASLAAIAATVLLAVAPIACRDQPPAEPMDDPPPQERSERSEGAERSERSGTQLDATVIITRTSAEIGGRADPEVQRVEATLYSAEGLARGTGATNIRQEHWDLLLLDPATDDEAYPMAGERVEIILFDPHDAEIERRTIDLPELTYSFDAEGGVVAGRVGRVADGWGPEGVARALITIGRPEIASAVAPVGEDGAFSFDVGEAAAAGSASVQLGLETVDGAVRLVEERRVPYVRVSLRPGDITGAMTPLTRVDLELSPAGGAPVQRGYALTGPDGRFESWIRSPTGRRIRPRAGDRIVVDDGRDRRDWVLPEHDGAWDREGGGIVGRGSPGNEISILMWNPWHAGADGEPRTVVEPDGAWSVAPSSPILPGTHYYVTERFPGGDELYLCYQNPVLHAEPGSAVVGVEALWEVEAELELRRGGETIARAAGGGPWSGNLELVFEDAGGEPVEVAAGDVIEGTLDGESVSLTVAALEAEIDGDEVVGTGPAGAEVGLATSSPLGDRVTLGDDGRFALDAHGRAADGAAEPGDRLSVFTLDESGHVSHRRFVGPSLEVRIDPPGVSGDVDPRGRAPRLVRRAPDGTTAAVPIEADTFGRFDAPLDQAIVIPSGSGSGEGAAVGTGQGAASGPASDGQGTDGAASGGQDTDGPASGGLERFELSQAGVTTAISVPVFTARIEQGREALVGTGPVYGIIDIKAWIGEAELPEPLATFIDQDGTWRAAFGPGAGGRFSFSFDEVSRFEVRLRLGSNALRLDVPGGRRPEG